MKIKLSIFLFYLCLALSNVAFAQKSIIQRVEPAFWWVGMKNPTVQVLVHGPAVSKSILSVNYPGVTVKEVLKVESPNYLFVTLNIAPDTKAGHVPLVFKLANKSYTYEYELKNKSTNVNRIQGFNPSDIIYLLMPDRFANGDPSNDNVAGILEKADRTKPSGRHGGDLKGIQNKLAYLKDLGMTAIWLNPVLENNQPAYSYHGYAITDLYKIDPRFGSNADYVNLVDKAQEMGLKVIMDMVHNHIGSNHWWMKDLPSKDWVHQFPSFTRSNFRLNTISDPYASQTDLQQMTNGWFDTSMPDLNQQNPLLATYLIQNSLWWIEYAGIDGIRMDTYPYPDKAFMALWSKAVKEEYPQFNLVGEIWVPEPAVMAYWLRDNTNRDGYQSYLPSSTDFPLQTQLVKAFNEESGGDSGLSRLYAILGQDFLYANPSNNVIFLDNHDISRFYTVVQKDVHRNKMATAFLLTTRGIPQVYYGFEILMDGDGANHPDVRKDFPGGWPGDKMDAFTTPGRTPVQNDYFDFVKTLSNWRKNKKVIHEGKLMQFIPEDNTYVYFRYNETETVMVIMNGNTQDKELKMIRFAERTQGFSRVKNVITGDMQPLGAPIYVPARTALVFELAK